MTHPTPLRNPFPAERPRLSGPAHGAEAPAVSRLHRLARVALLSTGIGLCAPSLPGAGKGEFKVAPGPTTISEEERVIAPDPNTRMEHGVILLEELERDESLGTDTKISYHLRAKILSNDGRELGDVEIPFNVKTGQLQQWWGRVLLPDGGQRILKQEELKPQMIVKANGQEFRALKGILPGIVPGSVIDYGYVYWESGVRKWTRVTLQRAWPLMELRYRWLPFSMRPFNLRTTRTEDLDVDARKEGRGLMITGKRLPPVPGEPYMPSEDAVRAMAHLYYMDQNTTSKDYWNEEAKRLDREARSFASEKAVQQVIEGLGLPQGADLMTKLRAAYDWIAAGVRSTAMLTAEETEKFTDPKKTDEERRKRSAVEVLAAKEALPHQADQLYMGVARSLGAEANLVMATDRTDRYWDPLLLTMEQFDWTLVAVRVPGTPDDQATIVDTASGLPFGEVPWVVTGAKGFLASANGYREIPLWPSGIEKNVFETKATISFDQETIRAAWTKTGTGQQGYFLRRELRKLPPEDRRKRIEELCGSSGDFEVGRAEAPKVLVDPVAGLLLECEGEYAYGAPLPGADPYTFSVRGPWFDAAPGLTASERVHPVVFAYPMIERTTLEIASPPGFAPKGPPAPAELESKFGRYTLVAKPTPSGYHVERELWLGPLLVRPEEYGVLREFLQDVNKADTAAVEFRRTGG